MTTESNLDKHYYELTYKPDGSSGYLIKEKTIKGGYAVPAGLFFDSQTTPQSSSSSSSAYQEENNVLSGGETIDIDDMDIFAVNSIVLPDTMLDYFMGFVIVDDKKTLTQGTQGTKGIQGTQSSSSVSRKMKNNVYMMKTRKTRKNKEKQEK